MSEKKQTPQGKKSPVVRDDSSSGSKDNTNIASLRPKK